MSNSSPTTGLRDGEMNNEEPSFTRRSAYQGHAISMKPSREAAWPAGAWAISRGGRAGRVDRCPSRFPDPSWLTTVPAKMQAPPRETHSATPKCKGLRRNRYLRDRRESGSMTRSGVSPIRREHMKMRHGMVYEGIDGSWRNLEDVGDWGPAIDREMKRSA